MTFDRLTRNYNAPNQLDRSLYLAIATNNPIMVEKLVRHGALINVSNYYVPLLHTAVTNLCPVVLDLLTRIQSGRANTSDLNARNTEGQTPLHMAIELESVIAVIILVEHGAIVDDESLRLARSSGFLVDYLNSKANGAPEGAGERRPDAAARAAQANPNAINATEMDPSVHSLNYNNENDGIRVETDRPLASAIDIDPSVCSLEYGNNSTNVNDFRVRGNLQPLIQQTVGTAPVTTAPATAPAQDDEGNDQSIDSQSYKQSDANETDTSIASPYKEEEDAAVDRSLVSNSSTISKSTTIIGSYFFNAPATSVQSSQNEKI